MSAIPHVNAHVETTAETVHAMFEWYDGPRTGIADFRGKPHLYESLWDQKSLGGCWTGIFMLMPLDTETFELAMEGWQIWRRWEKTFRAKLVTQEPHGVLPEDTPRSEDLKALLSERLEMQPQRAFLQRGCFDSPAETVQWFATDETGDGLITYSKLVAPKE